VKIDDVLAEGGGDGEGCELPEVLPEGVKVSRPQAGRPAAISRRLSPSELEPLKHAAEEAQLAVSTFIQIAAVGHVHSRGEGASAETTRRLERAVFDRVE